MPSNNELYNILGVEPSASDDQIRSAYERMIAENPEGSPMHERIV
jgi:DnaJ-class molecular chaperone